MLTMALLALGLWVAVMALVIWYVERFHADHHG